jgi:hypothetical protein
MAKDPELFKPKPDDWLEHGHRGRLHVDDADVAMVIIEEIAHPYPWQVGGRHSDTGLYNHQSVEEAGERLRRQQIDRAAVWIAERNACRMEHRAKWRATGLYLYGHCACSEGGRVRHPRGVHCGKYWYKW